MGDPPGEDAGLARAGAGHHQQRASPVDDGLALGRGQALEKLLGQRRAVRAFLAIATPRSVLWRRPDRQVRPVRLVRSGGRGLARAFLRLAHSHSIVPGGFEVMS